MADKKEVWTVQAILNWTRQYFLDKGVENPRLDAEVLLSHILKKERLYLYVHFDQPLEDKELAAFRIAVKQRAARLPVAYIIGSKEFMGLDFEVTPAVLIPRPDTEILVEAAIKRLARVDEPCILDLGTGSGAVCISLLKNLPTARGITVDISSEALIVAKRNAAKHQIEQRLTFYEGNLFVPVKSEKFKAILSNPPYIPSGDIAGLTPEVRQEPNLALAGGEDGLDFYRRIIQEGKEYLTDNGFIAMEVGIGQARLVADLAEKTGYYKVSDIIKDYGGIERVVVLEGL
ncbi:peptide chain release factor N(5)-glutamine methyltransferase [Pelosinus propionicus]|uniref:Release factor glutamine methyltransferase n=1 Tax=Pelosinus propionicus DSM 13327 TaxID=1123291 RepID=A0A1I4JAD3_9FIRM|nr:peptide chain release factor N(5)-glutamine methyltransferase [Pelosinus propionicus]SFL63171.1 release factor glutamine methyltransferase [Pelosinus propionicus DSM 13327]